MSSNTVIAGIAVLTLATTAYVAITLPKAQTAPTRSSGLQESSTSATAAETEELAQLRDEIRSLSERLDQQVETLNRLVERVEAAPVVSGTTPNFDRARNSDPTEDLAVRVAETVQSQLDAKLDRMASRQQNRNMGGEWKAPIDELAAELGLDDRQKESARIVFDQARDQVFDILKTKRDDGGSLLDDLAEGLKAGDPDAFGAFMGRMFTEKVPGTEVTYLGEFMALTEQVKGDLSSHFDSQQLKKLETLNVAVLEVETGYDPVGDYLGNPDQ